MALQQLSALMITFYFLKKKKKINTIKSLAQLKNAKLVNLRWRFQKNQDNDQQLSNSSDKNPDLCFVKAAVDIRRRISRSKLDAISPIDVFLQHDTISKEYKFITDKHIHKLLQKAAAVVYTLKDIEDLQKFTAHSIRVGACVALHVLNKETSFIQFRLRWRSDAFKMYLRNVAALAVQHYKARQAKINN